jgi:asparagine N-glycosylation enzyme membrane subunit Stt3
MNIIIAVVTGRLQDEDNNSYDRVVIVYVVLAAGSVVVSGALIALSLWSVDLRRLQWTWKQRVANGQIINERKERFVGEKRSRNTTISASFFGAFCVLVVGSWIAYFWGVATGNES